MWLTKRDRVYHERSRLRGLRKLVYSALDEVHVGIIILLDGISVGDHQNNGSCRPRRVYRSDMLDPPGLRMGKTPDKKIKVHDAV